MNFNGGRGGGRAAVVNGNTGVDTRILRHQITDLQQDVTSVPAEQRACKEQKKNSLSMKDDGG